MLHILREAMVGVTKPMMFKYFAEVSQHFSTLTEKGQNKFGLRLCKYANIIRRRVNGCTQMVPVAPCYKATCISTENQWEHVRGCGCDLA